MATIAQLEANRRNALKSTGPRTAEGKDASRRNALTHGLAAETLAMSDEAEAEAIAARVAGFSASLNPRGEYDEWLVEEMALSSLRIERCRGVDVALRSRSISRAASCWDEDREAEAEELGGKISRSPSIVACRLRGSKQGCAWLIARWEGLRGALEAKGEWNPAQKKLALDLLGTPKEFRDGPSLLDGDKPALIAAQIARLEAQVVRAMAELDELDRAAAEVGFGRDLDKPLALVRRYEAANVRRMEAARKQLGKGRPAGWESPRVVTVTPPAPAIRVEAVAPAPPKSAPVHPPMVAVRDDRPASNRKNRRALKAMARRG